MVTRPKSMQSDRQPLTQPRPRFVLGNRIKKIVRDIRMHKMLYLMILIPLVYLFVFQYIPMIGVIISFQDFSFRRGYFGSEWVGFEHFEWLASNPAFQDAFANTLKINFLRIVVGFPAPIILALIINEVRHTYYKRTVQTLSYLPYFISWVVLAGIFNNLLAQDYGAVNSFAASMGLPRIDYLQDPDVFPWTLVISDIWKTVGWGSIIYLATISTVSTTLYEAAEVDGASRWQQILYITLPALRPTMLVILIISIGNVLRVGFDQVFNLYNPLVYESGDIIQTYIVRSFASMPNFSRLAAAGLVQSFLGMLMLIAANAIIKRMRNGGGLY